MPSPSFGFFLESALFFLAADADVVVELLRFQEMALELGFELDFDIAVEQFAGTSMKENLQFISKNIFRITGCC